MPFRTDPSSSAAIIGDKACIYCGTSLRGLSSRDNCPECGKLAGYSLLGDHLRDVDSGWIRGVMMGIWFVIGGYATLSLVISLQFLAEFDPKAEVFDSTFFRFILTLIGRMFFMVGILLMTQAETSESLIARRRGVANVLRISSLIYVGFAFLPEQWLRQTAGETALMAMIATYSIAAIVSQSVIWVHLRRIIDRTPRREVARLLSLAVWVSIVLFAFISRGSTLMVERFVPNGQTAMIGRLVVHTLWILQRIGAIYLLLMTIKAIRRTIGYWDN